MTTATSQVINDVLPRTQATAATDQTVFNANWTANDSTDIVVYARTSDEDADDATQLVSSDDYVVTFIGSLQTVRVTFNDERTDGDIITITRATPASRTNLYTNTNFTPSMLNQDFGILTLVDQQAQLYDEDLAPRYNVSCTFTDTTDLTIDNILPILDANQFWVKNSGNTAITVGTLDSSSLPTAGPFVTYTADDSLTSIQDLGLLGDGILSQTVTDSSATISILDIPLTVSNGGTGSTSFTAFSVLVAGGTSTEALSNVSGVGTSGQVLTSNGSGTPPTWQTQDQAGTIVVITYSANDTYTKPSNLAYISIECIGGGGGGGGSASAGATGQLISGGGGAGTYSRSFYNAADVGATEAVTVGANGAGGVGDAVGSAGGQSSFGVLCVAPGGQGGINGPTPGQGGVAGTGNLVTAPGMPGLGGMAASINTTQYSMGGGASSLWGAGGNSSLSGSTTNGGAASGYGAGGGGGCSSNAGGTANGGDGVSGRIIIIEYLTE